MKNWDKTNWNTRIVIYLPYENKKYASLVQFFSSLRQRRNEKQKKTFAKRKFHIDCGVVDEQWNCHKIICIALYLYPLCACVFTLCTHHSIFPNTCFCCCAIDVFCYYVSNIFYHFPTFLFLYFFPFVWIAFFFRFISLLHPLYNYFIYYYANISTSNIFIILFLLLLYFLNILVQCFVFLRLLFIRYFLQKRCVFICIKLQTMMLVCFFLLTSVYGKNRVSIKISERALALRKSNKSTNQ